MARHEDLMNSKLRFASGVSVLFTTLAFGHIMIKDTQNMMSHHDESQSFIVVHTIIAIVLGVLSLTGGFLLLSNRRRPA
jgi:nitrate reductase gamma subunit